MANDAAATALPPRAATIAEIKEAIEALSEVDSERLHQIAINRIVRIGRCAANGRTSDDLLQEALWRILNQSRKWHPERAPFVQFVIGVVFSVASEWAAHRKRNLDTPDYAKLESEAAQEDEDGSLLSPFAALAGSTLDPESNLTAAEAEAEQSALVREMEQQFADDENAVCVLMGWEDGMDGPAIRREFGFSEKLYETTVRRIKRQSRKILEKRNAG